MVAKNVRSHAISVGYTCYQRLINGAVCVGETCSIKSVGQCVWQKIALVYFL